MESSYCYSCFILNDKVPLKPYIIKNEGLKTVFEIQHVPLCYLCWRLAERCEVFIDSVQESQEMLLLSTEPPNPTSKRRPQLRLYHKRLDPISISGIDNKNKNNFIESNSSKEVENELALEAPEFKVEFTKCDPDYEDDFSYSEETYDCVKFEEEDIKGDLLQELVKLEEQRKYKKPKKRKEKSKKQPAKRKRTEPKNTVPKIKKCTIIKEENKIKLKIKDEPQIKLTPVHITIEQLKQEMEVKSNNVNYVNAPFKCTDCVKGYQTKFAYKAHMTSHHMKSGKLVCDICKQRKETMVKLRAHIRAHTERFHCPYCPSICRARKKMKSHIREFHIQGDLLKCDHCHRVFRQRMSLVRHIHYKHTSDIAICAHCDKKMANKTSLVSHIQRLHPSELSKALVVSSYVCDDCGKSFIQLSALNNHRLKHTDQKDYYCVECDKAYKTKESLKRHLTLTAVHVSSTELPLGCSYCEKRFGIRRDLERHVNAMHTNSRPYQCKECPKTFTCKSNLQKHHHSVHSGLERPRIFPCNYCDKIFNRVQILREHVRIHTGERPFHCDRCPATFTQSSVLMAHVRCTHLNLQRNGQPKIR